MCFYKSRSSKSACAPVAKNHKLASSTSILVMQSHSISCYDSGQLKIEKGEDYPENTNSREDYGRKLIKLYSFASFLVLESLMNATIDAFFEHSCKWFLGDNSMDYIYKQSLEDSKLGDFIRRRKAEYLRKNGRAALDTDSGQQFFAEHFLRGKDRAKSMLGALLDSPTTFKKSMGVCQWHTHQQTPICPKTEGSWSDDDE